MGVKHGSRHFRPMTPELRAKIVKLWREGLNLATIRIRTGIGTDLISKTLAVEGIRARKTRGSTSA